MPPIEISSKGVNYHALAISYESALAEENSIIAAV